MKANLFFLALAMVLPGLAHADQALYCQLTSDPTSSVNLGVDEASPYGDVVLFDFGGPHQKSHVASAALPTGALAQQINNGAVVVMLGDSARPDTTEVTDGVLFAVTRVAQSDRFLGYVSLPENGSTVYPITCQVK